MEAPLPADTRTHRARWPIIVVVLLGLLAVGLGVLWLNRPPTEPAPPETYPLESPDVTSMEEIEALTDGKVIPPVSDGTLPQVDADDHIFGDQAAALSIVEYSNFGNTYAALLHPELRDLVADDANVNWIVRHYPLSEADYLPALAAECAYFEKGHPGFWSYFDLAFSLQTPPKQSLIDLAETVGLDAEIFEQCLDRQYALDRVIRDLQDGRLDAGVTVLPSYAIVNNFTGELRLVEGANAVSYLRQVLDAVR